MRGPSEGAADRGVEPTAQWFVCVALPVEAASRAEAVREFWTYVRQLGPEQLPAYVWPRGDELAMQAYLLDRETNLDPEEDPLDEDPEEDPLDEDPEAAPL